MTTPSPIPSPHPLLQSPSWQRLAALAKVHENTHLNDLFAQEPERATQCNLQACGLSLDFSKNVLPASAVSLLVELARERGLQNRQHAMYEGESINNTEDRAVLHTALRHPSQRPEVLEVIARMAEFATAVRTGSWTGYSGATIQDIVHIGIGGSHLGPELAVEALQPYACATLKVHFVANVDGHALHALLPKLDAQRTLFIVASKTFTTLETMMNAQTARDWLTGAGCTAIDRHVVALSTNVQEATRFGVHPDKVFPFWDWVGGRYSLWSAIGLPLMLAIGPEHFRAFLGGAHEMDRHFRDTPFAQNIPILLAMIGIWNRNFRHHASVSIAPYDERLRLLPAYLQQLEMESNGKSVQLDGTPVPVGTAPILWGQAGTNGQHAYFQMLHQGTDVVPLDFIACVTPHHTFTQHHRALLANCFAQSEALMRGKTATQAEQEMLAQGMNAEQAHRLAPHRRFPGNRPSNTLLLDTLDPATFGALLALYEHKVFVQGVIWGINSFDQWGVELGKVLAKAIDVELGGTAPLKHDGSTNALIERIRRAGSTT